MTKDRELLKKVFNIILCLPPKAAYYTKDTEEIINNLYDDIKFHFEDIEKNEKRRENWPSNKKKKA